MKHWKMSVLLVWFAPFLSSRVAFVAWVEYLEAGESQRTSQLTVIHDPQQNKENRAPQPK